MNTRRLLQNPATSSPLRNEIDLTLDPQPQVQMTHPHPMQLTLDSGKLTWRSTNQDLVSFLDLHRKYHHEFLKRLENHVREHGYGWQDLVEQESELASCARGFVKRNGRRYWGSQESREKYFYKDAFRDLDTLTIYPQRKEEITRVVKLLLEKKACSITAENQGRPRKRESIPKEFYISSPERVTEPLDTRLYDGRPLFTPKDKGMGSISKRKKTESIGLDLDSPSTETITDIPNDDDGSSSPSKRGILPFSVFTTSAAGTGSGSTLAPSAKTQSQSQSPAKHSTAVAAPALALNQNSVEMEIDMHEPSSASDISAAISSNQREMVSTRDPRAVPGVVNAGAGASEDPFVRLYLDRSYYPERTIFLVSSNQQSGMGPVWVPFREFSSAGSFLESMARECQCHPDEYYFSWGRGQSQSQSQDQDRDQDRAQRQSASTSTNVVAATVRLEWSELVVIRVRHGKDQDWAIFRRELQRAWSESEAGSESVSGIETRGENPCCESDLRGNPNDGNGEQTGEKQHYHQHHHHRQQRQQFKISVLLHIMD